MVLPVPVGAFRMICRYYITLSNRGVGSFGIAIALARSSINDIMYLNRVPSIPLLLSSGKNLSKSSIPSISIIPYTSYINCMYTAVYYFNSFIYESSVSIYLYADLLLVIVSYRLSLNLVSYSSEVINGFAAMLIHMS
jgi:hypothetical protein